MIESLGQSSSMEEALLMLDSKYPKLVRKLWFRVADEIEKRSDAYVSRYITSSIEIGSALFDRKRRLRWSGPIGLRQLSLFGVTLEA